MKTAAKGIKKQSLEIKVFRRIMNSKIKSIVETIIESSRADIKAQIKYLEPTLSFDEKLDIYLALNDTICELTKEDKLEVITLNQNTNINDAYEKAIAESEKMTKLIDKVEFAASLIQPISDHSLRGTLFYMEKELTPQNP